MDIMYEINKLKQKTAMSVAWMLPRWLVELAGVRLWANATTGKYSDTEVPGVTVDVALKRWRSRDGGDGTFDTEDVSY